MDNKHLVNIAIQHIKDDNPHGIDDIKKGIYSDIDGIHADLNTVKTDMLQVNSKSDSIQGFLDSIKSEVDDLPSVIEARGKLAERVSLSFIDNKISEEEAKRISETLDALNEAKGYTDMAKVGTEEYINSIKTEVIDYSDTLLYHFEEALGPLAFEDKIELARLGETIIDGGYLKTEVIKAHSIGAHHINTNELVVGDNITMGPNAVITWDNLSEDSKENLKGEDAIIWTIGGDGYWYKDGVKTGDLAVGADGTDGEDGTEWTIGEDGYWYENGVKTDKKAIGEDGYTPVKGTDYFDGEDGQDGESKYLWIKYSQNSNGNPATDDPAGAKYIGIATTITNVKPSHYLSYTWSLIKGEDGVKGETGPNGQTSYLHIKYSNNGYSFTSNGGETVGSWIGTYVDFTEADSTVFSRYTWNKVKGEDGKDGKDGSDANVPDYITKTKITSTTIESPSITGGTITGGSIRSTSTINVATDAYIGNNLYLGSQSINSAKSIAFNDRTAITGVGRGINSKLDLSAYKVDISSVYVDINAGTTTIHYDLNIGEVGKIYFDSGGSINFNNASVLNFSGNDISKGTVPYARLPSDNLVHSSGSNARGKWIRFGSGVQMCWYNTILTYTSGTTIDNSWTYPMAFIDPPTVSGNATESATVVHRSLAVYFASITDSSCTALMSRPTGSADFSTSHTRSVSLMAVGMWK